MLGRNQISDKEITKTVGQALSRSGASSQPRITTAVYQGTVTLTGLLQFSGQRSPILESVSSVAGVHRVVDLMQVIERELLAPEPLRPTRQSGGVGAAPQNKTLDSIPNVGEFHDS